MNSNDAKPTNYSEFMLGEQSKSELLQIVTNACGFNYAGADTIQGLSGLTHRFDGIGSKGKNVLLIVGDADMKDSDERLDPYDRMRKWRDTALLKGYDVQAALERDGYIVDIMFFHNLNYWSGWVGSGTDPREWIEVNNLPQDIGFSHTISGFDIPVMSNEALSSVAQSVGACFLSLDDFNVQELSQLLGPQSDSASRRIITDILTQKRIIQYFAPPTDELILSAYDFTRDQSRELPEIVHRQAAVLGHEPSANVLLPEVDFRDPVATAKELENHKYISFQYKAEFTEQGYRVTQSIRKTAQGSFVIRILKSLRISELARSIIDSLK